MGDLKQYDFVKAWISDKCIPIVREITFENAEELTEEGLPFLLLFHHPDDVASVELYKNEIATQLVQEKGRMIIDTPITLVPEVFFHRKETRQERKRSSERKPLVGVMRISLSCYDRCQSASRNRLTSNQ